MRRLTKMLTPKTIDFTQCTSKYEQRMRKLSCKIFNEFYVPELTQREFEYGLHHQPVMQWVGKWFSDMCNFERHQSRPFDLNREKNPNYYPPHPQIRELTHTLREYGLFRDEHRDFNEMMKEKAMSKGKVFRERKGPLKKEDKSSKKK